MGGVHELDEVISFNLNRGGRITGCHQGVAG
jgi:hypothetical protein